MFVICYFIRGTGGWRVSVMCAILGVQLKCLLAAVLCGSPATVCPYPMSTGLELCSSVNDCNKKEGPVQSQFVKC